MQKRRLIDFTTKTPKVLALALAMALTIAASSLASEEKFRRHDGGAKDMWIVELAEHSRGANVAEALTRQFGGKLRYVYTNTINGFAVEMPEPAARALSRSPHVALVEQDALVTPTAVQTGTPVTWALDYIDQRGGFDYTYVYNRTGLGVRIYILDTGISNGDDFPGNRFINGWTNDWRYIESYGIWYPNYDDDLCNDQYECHGTKVASIAAGATYGVAKQATVVNVKVHGYSHNTAGDVIGGLDYAVGNHYQHPNEGAVANISLDVAGTFEQSLFEKAVIRTIDAGVIVVTGAGNSDSFAPADGGDACGSSPARLGNIAIAGHPYYENPNGRTTITVASTSPNGSRTRNVGPVERCYEVPTTCYQVYWHSNFGRCVDIFAPGDGVRARGVPNFPPDEFAGTSASSPYVAGVVALYLEGRGGNYDPNAVEAALKANATPNIVGDPGPDSPNLFLYSRVDLWP